MKPTQQKLHWKQENRSLFPCPLPTPSSPTTSAAPSAPTTVFFLCTYTLLATGCTPPPPQTQIFPFSITYFPPPDVFCHDFLCIRFKALLSSYDFDDFAQSNSNLCLCLPSSRHRLPGGSSWGKYCLFNRWAIIKLIQNINHCCSNTIHLIHHHHHHHKSSIIKWKMKCSLYWS